MNLFPYQKVAAEALRAEIAKGGPPLTFSMPVGSGRSIVVAEAIRDIGPVVFVCRVREMGEQFRDICQRLDVKNVKIFWAPGYAAQQADFSEYKVVILDEAHRPWPDIDHPCVIKQGFLPDMPFTLAMQRLPDGPTAVTVASRPTSETTKPL